MTLSILQDDDLLAALGFSVAPSRDDGLELLTGTDAKRAWRAVPANWRHELELTRARRGSVSRDEHLAKARAHAADPAVIAERLERANATKRARYARPEVREAACAAKAARLDAMPAAERRARWARDSANYRARKRAQPGAAS